MTTLDEIRALRDEIRLQLHLAGMDARDAWSRLEPKVHELEHALARRGETAATAVIGTIQILKSDLYKLRDRVRNS